MDIHQAIRQRRTVKDFTSEPIAADKLERILEAGLWAQNHGMTQPWRFTSLGLETREALAASQPAFREKILNAPSQVIVSQALAADPGVRREDYAAISCAIQNIALAAWEEGVGLLWSTGRWTRDTRIYPLAGIDAEKEEIVAFLNLGYPAEIPTAPPRKPLKAVLRYLP